MYGQEVSATDPRAGVIDFRCHTAADWHAFDQRPWAFPDGAWGMRNRV